MSFQRGLGWFFRLLYLYLSLYLSVCVLCACVAAINYVCLYAVTNNEINKIKKLRNDFVILFRSKRTHRAIHQAENGEDAYAKTGKFL